MNASHFPEALWSEILPGLWQGGTHDLDVVDGGYIGKSVSKRDFDSVYTLYGYANPTDWRMKEIRFPFMDGDMSDIDPESDLWLLVSEAHSDWKAGKRVLIRCQAGLNRSGLVMALVLIREGYAPEEAIKLIRRQRGEAALCNYRFVRWLNNEANLDFWRTGSKLAA